MPEDPKARTPELYVPKAPGELRPLVPRPPLRPHPHPHAMPEDPKARTPQLYVPRQVSVDS